MHLSIGRSRLPLPPRFLLAESKAQRQGPSLSSLQLPSHNGNPEGKELEQELDGSKASVQRQLELAKKLQEFEALRQTVQELEDEIAAIPPEIREKYNAKTERKEILALE